MSKEYTREQFWELYEKLPQKLKETIFSGETAENIFNICSKNGIKDNQISEVARYTGRVLLKILSEKEFDKILEKELKINKDISQKIAREINRLIFLPVKSSLSETNTKEKDILPAEQPPQKPPSKDAYREKIE